MKRNVLTRRRLTYLGVIVVAATAAVAGGVGAQAASQAKPNIVWLEQGANNPYWDAQHKAAAEAGRRLGFTFKAVSGNNNPSDQASVMKQLVDQGVDVIMLNAIDPKAMAPALAYAKQKGVKVLNLYGVEPKATASVTFDEIRSGRVDAKYAATLLKKRYGSLKGKVAVLMGIIGQPASDLRAKGFVDYMKKNGVDVVSQQPTGWQADKASAAMQDWLVKYPDLALVYALSDTLAVPAVTVTDRANKTCTVQKDWTANSSCVAFVSVDGIFADQVQKGKLFATELYSPEWSGYLYAKLAHDVALGKKMPKTTTIDSFLVTPENAACSLKMINDMKSKMKTFPFGPSLQLTASKTYHCKVLDKNM
jgi:ribose transport system substrate-binding protein